MSPEAIDASPEHTAFLFGARDLLNAIGVCGGLAMILAMTLAMWLAMHALPGKSVLDRMMSTNAALTLVQDDTRRTKA